MRGTGLACVRYWPSVCCYRYAVRCAVLTQRMLLLPGGAGFDAIRVGAPLWCYAFAMRCPVPAGYGARRLLGDASVVWSNGSSGGEGGEEGGEREREGVLSSRQWGLAIVDALQGPSEPLPQDAVEVTVWSSGLHTVYDVPVVEALLQQGHYVAARVEESVRGGHEEREEREEREGEAGEGEMEGEGSHPPISYSVSAMRCPVLTQRMLLVPEQSTAVAKRAGTSPRFAYALAMRFPVLTDAVLVQSSQEATTAGTTVLFAYRPTRVLCDTGTENAYGAARTIRRN
eukprot:2498234-Rhodomonas_salina.1